ncbi:hypothetical protein CHS0354_031114 [Potamilus streckersoni]|uniref:Uncharacterized protein n=1 Tax=Potamilus streckersoni TaxID=2493646 RepID=A0AAE0TCR2_9BIVA|nr:hypothetical protein CHS0354_031114 [Potamilus streckersoni]
MNGKQHTSNLTQINTPDNNTGNSTFLSSTTRNQASPHESMDQANLANKESHNFPEFEDIRIGPKGKQLKGPTRCKSTVNISTTKPDLTNPRKASTTLPNTNKQQSPKRRQLYNNQQHQTYKKARASVQQDNNLNDLTSDTSCTSTNIYKRISTTRQITKAQYKDPHYLQHHDEQSTQPTKKNSQSRYHPSYLTLDLSCLQKSKESLTYRAILQELLQHKKGQIKIHRTKKSYIIIWCYSAAQIKAYRKITNRRNPYTNHHPPATQTSQVSTSPAATNQRDTNMPELNKAQKTPANKSPFPTAPTFTIWQWKCRVVNTNYLELAASIQESKNKPSIICLQEIKLKANQTTPPKINDYDTTYLKNRTTGHTGGGLAIYVSQRLSVHPTTRHVRQH